MSYLECSLVLFSCNSIVYEALEESSVDDNTANEIEYHRNGVV